MKKNLRACVEQPTFSEPQCLLDMNDYRMIEAGGLIPDPVRKRSAHLSASWYWNRTRYARIPMADSDLSGFRFLTFSVWAVNGAGKSFYLRFESNRAGQTDGGYVCHLPVQHNGWNDYRIELPFIASRNDPAGWNHIQAVVFDCTHDPSDGQGTVLSVDSFFLWENLAPYFYLLRSELKGAAVFSRTGAYSVIDRKRIPNAPDASPNVRPFENKGTLWLPMGVVAAILGHTPVADTGAGTLNFIYRRKKYTFTAGVPTCTVDGKAVALDFSPVAVEGTLFFPANFVRTFFRWRQMFTDPTGLIVLSNRRAIFDSDLEEPFLWNLNAELTLSRPGGRAILEDLHRKVSNPDRGRLLLSPDEWIARRKTVREEGSAGAAYAWLRSAYGKSSDDYRAAPVAQTLSSDPDERARQFRHAADRLIAFSALYRLAGEKHYAVRACAEANALGALPSWDAETAPENAGIAVLGLSLCYDWCHPAWSEAEKMKTERAALRYAMRPGVEALNGKGKMWRAGSSEAALINAGLTAAALAFADVYPETAFRLLDRIPENAAKCFRAYVPDGGCEEGAHAWEIRTRALVLMLAMLEGACGKTYGLDALPGFAATARFPFVLESGNGAWSFRNGSSAPIDTAMLPWFTLRYGQPLPAWLRRRDLTAGKKPDLLDIVFRAPVEDKLKVSLPLDTVYRRAGLALLRSDWGETATLLAVKGGNNSARDGWCDAGSVLLESEGERFFTAVGDYPELNRTATGQNTLLLYDPASGEVPGQDRFARAELLEARSAVERSYAVVDMAGTDRRILRGKRGILLAEGRRLAVIQDELTLSAPANAVWTAYTPAKILLQRARTLILEMGEKRLICRLYGAGSSARFEVHPVENTGLTRLTVTVPVRDKLRMAIACTPYLEGDDRNRSFWTVRPIRTWGEA